jgi:hypothetical protein
MNTVAVWVSIVALLAVGVFTVTHLVRSRMRLTQETRGLYAPPDRRARRDPSGRDGDAPSGNGKVTPGG